MEQILVAEDIYKTYRTASGPVRALQGISLSFETGLFYAVIGRSCKCQALFYIVR